jgi:hypothetical protein
MNVNEKIQAILAETTEAIQKANAECEENFEGGILLVAVTPVDNSHVGQHCVVLGKESSIVTALAMAVSENPGLGNLLSKSTRMAPIVKLLEGMPSDMLKGLAQDLGC